MEKRIFCTENLKNIRKPFLSKLKSNQKIFFQKKYRKKMKRKRIEKANKKRTKKLRNQTNSQSRLK